VTGFVPNKYFQIDGIATHVMHTGRTTLPERPPDLSAGETILCLHGSGGNANLFRTVMDGLQPRHSPLAFDQPGHGRSGELDSLGSIERMAAFVYAFCQKLGLGPAVLLGHDMGAAVALRLALTHPESVRALVLCSAGARFELAEADVELARKVAEGKARRPFDPRAFSKQTSQEVMREAFVEGLKTDPRARFGDLLACREWDDAARLGEISAATLVIHGEEVHAEVRRQAEILAERIPGATSQLIPGAGHEILLEAPQALAVAVDDFLRSLPDGAAR
jgi:pimeloyl-ACP methyl ester carboxylesterase